MPHGHPRYCIADRFFQAAFGGSFLNHQWLIAARTPVFENPSADGRADLHSIVDANGMPSTYPPQYVSPSASPLRDAPLTVACGGRPARRPVRRLRREHVAARFPRPTTARACSRSTGRRSATVSTARVSSGRGTREVGRTRTGTSARRAGRTVRRRRAPHLISTRRRAGRIARTRSSSSTTSRSTTIVRSHPADGGGAEESRRASPRRGGVRAAGRALVGSLRSQGRQLRHLACEENEHPGYSSEPEGSDHLVGLLRAIEGSACAGDTLAGRHLRRVRRAMGPRAAAGTSGRSGSPRRLRARHPSSGARAVRRCSPADFVVDHEPHDTTSILATIEHRFGLEPLGKRDAAVRDLAPPLDAAAPRIADRPRPDHRAVGFVAATCVCCPSRSRSRRRGIGGEVLADGFGHERPQQPAAVEHDREHASALRDGGSDGAQPSGRRERDARDAHAESRAPRSTS